MNATGQYKLIQVTYETSESLISLKSLCSLAKVSKSGYYAWKVGKTHPSIKEEKNLAYFQLILQVYSFRGYDKGVMGIYMRLLKMNVRMNHKKIRRLMRKFGLFCSIRKSNLCRKMMKAMKTNAVADNLLKREFKGMVQENYF